MKLTEKIILTNMCRLYKDDGSFLVEDRQKQDWPGITFPGGHVKANETMEQSVIREVKEETGLTIHSLREIGVYEWNEPAQGVRHVAALYRSSDFSGELQSSKEGRVFWIRPEEVKNYKLSTDMDKLIMIMTRDLAQDKED